MTDVNAETRTIQRYGWKPSLPDPRDLVADVDQLPILPIVDPRDHLPPIYDQGQLGSCTSNAVCAALRYDRMLDDADVGDLSRLFVYYGERVLEGSPVDQDTGAYGRDGFKWARRVGAPPERYWGYDIATFAGPPPAEAVEWAPDYRLVKDYRAVRRYVTAFKRVLSNRQTIAFGFAVFDSFESSRVDDTGVVPYPDVTRERMLGGHEMLVVGYDDHAMPEYALCRNSWGTGWGEDGYCWMPWAYLLDTSLSADFRTIRRPLA